MRCAAPRSAAAPLLALCLAALLSCGVPRALALPGGGGSSAARAAAFLRAPTISEGTLNLPFTARAAAEGDGDGDGDALISVKRARRGLGAIPLLFSELVVEVLPTRTAGAGCALEAVTDELVPRRARPASGGPKGGAAPLRLELSPLGADVPLRVRCAPRAPSPLARLLANGGLPGASPSPGAKAGGASASATFTISAFHQRRSSHPAALAAGVMLLASAPALATSSAAFYGGAMAAAATTLALLAAVALVRAAPGGGRAKRAVGAASALAALLTPSMTGLRDALAASYFRAAAWPLLYTARALLGPAAAGGDAAEALRPALLAAAVALCVLSAGAGFFVARRFLIDVATGTVLPGPSLFVLWLLRAAAAAALLHATSDGPASLAVAALALAATGGAARRARHALIAAGGAARSCGRGAARVATLPVRAVLAAVAVGARAAAAMLVRRAAGAHAAAAAAEEADRAAPVPRTPTPPGSSAATPASRATSAGLGALLRRRGSGAPLSAGGPSPLPGSLDPEPDVAAAPADAARRRSLLSPAAAAAAAHATTAAALAELTSSPQFGAWLVRQAGAGRLSLTPGEAPARAASHSALEEWETSDDADGDDDAGDTSADTRGTPRQRKRAQAAPRSQPRSRRG